MLIRQSLCHVGDGRSHDGMFLPVKLRRPGPGRFCGPWQGMSGGIILKVSRYEAEAARCPRRNDVFGARDAGCFAWLYGLDVLSLDEVAERVLWGSEDDDMLRAIAQ